MNSVWMARIHLDRVARAAAKLESARQELLEAMRDAKESGETYEDIGAAAGMTRQGAWKILNPPRHR